MSKFENCEFRSATNSAINLCKMVPKLVLFKERKNHQQLVYQDFQNNPIKAGLSVSCKFNLGIS